MYVIQISQIHIQILLLSYKLHKFTVLLEPMLIRQQAMDVHYLTDTSSVNLGKNTKAFKHESEKSVWLNSD